MTGIRRTMIMMMFLGVFTMAFLVVGSGSRCDERRFGETLYNGIRLPTPWPPKQDKLTNNPPSLPPYLVSPPKVISIDVGRQLFVDDFLIERTDLKRTFHLAEYYSRNPVLKPDKPWELEGKNPTAMIFSDGVWYDPADKLFKMWYMGGYVGTTCFATSKNGILWEKPSLDVVQGTNIVYESIRDSSTVWLDLDEKDPKRRYKLFVHRVLGDPAPTVIYPSSDGIHWGNVAAESGICGDRTTAFYNPFRKVWVFSIRESFPGVHRCRRYWESRNLAADCKWEPGEPTLWVAADRLDPRREDLNKRTELYNLDCVAYESLLLGLFTIWRGQPEDRPKPNDIVLGYSRDGFNWHRPDRRAFIPVSEDERAWNWGNVQSAGGCCLVVGDKLYFYVSGRSGKSGSLGDGVCGTGLAFLRRDGFASMDAEKKEGTLTTRAVRFKGKYLFVNIDAPNGELRVEALDGKGRVIQPFSRENCVPIRVDKTLQAVNWKGANDLSAISGKPVKFRFYLRNGRLYSFWISPDRSGASHGYVAAGGPGFTGPTDTVGAGSPGGQ